jgi:hypothetical protein
MNATATIATNAKSLNDTYRDFLKSKRIVAESSGMEIPKGKISPVLYDFQDDICRWALRRGRALAALDCGLGKTLIQEEWARPIWYGIRESDTLNKAEARSEEDDRHVCPLQLGTIERCIRLWSNPGETVFSPFAGIGSEGYVAVEHGRKFIGIELKTLYAKTAARNIRNARSKQQNSLFSEIEQLEPRGAL